jgi:hypothetical protein
MPLSLAWAHLTTCVGVNASAPTQAMARDSSTMLLLFTMAGNQSLIDVATVVVLGDGSDPIKYPIRFLPRATRRLTLVVFNVDARLT